MCRIIATLTLLLVFSISLFGTNLVPVVDLPPKPTKQLMSKLSNNAGLFAEKIISYYTAAACYEAQLNLMGLKPAKELIAPTLEQLATPSQRVLQTQWQQAAALHRQVSSIAVTSGAPNEEALRKNVFELQAKLSELKAKNAELQLQLKELDIFPELYYNALKGVDGIKKRINRHTIPTFGVSAGVTTLVFSDDRVSSNAGVDVGLVFNPTTLLGISNLLDVWFNYSTPNIKTTHTLDYWYGFYDETLIHNTNILSTGINIILPVSKIFEIEKIYWNLKGGVGYYWIDNRVPNSNVDNNLWKGVVLKAETELINLTSRFPFGIYASATFNHTNSNLMLYHPSHSSIDFGSKWFNSLNAGLRFYLTGSRK